MCCAVLCCALGRERCGSTNPARRPSPQIHTNTHTTTTRARTHTHHHTRTHTHTHTHTNNPPTPTHHQPNTNPSQPENFLLTDGSAAARLKMTDFGCSVFYQDGQEFSDLVGSAYYIAPEVLRQR